MRPLRSVISAALLSGLAVQPSFAQTQNPPPLTITPDGAFMCAGGSATFEAKRGTAVPNVIWTMDPTSTPGKLETKGANVVTYTAPGPTLDNAGVDVQAVEGSVRLKATDSAGSSTALIVLRGRCPTRSGGELVRATIGLEQVGAAGTESTQKYSFDFFISRPIPFRSRTKPGAGDTNADYFGPRARWWGDVRIGSYPQQINSDLATFTSEFAKNVGGVPVNKLAQTAEFMTGPEVRILQSRDARDAIAEPSRQRFALMAFAGIGSIGPFPPGDDPAVLTVPADKDSPQYAAFLKARLDVTSKYVAFVPENRHQFSRQWGAGLRLYTFYADTTGSSKPLPKIPASVEFSLGQNELVAPRIGGSTPIVWHAAAYYPFALGDRTDPNTLVLYFFGDANMRLGHTDPVTPLYLAPAVDDRNAAIPLTNKDVSIVSVAPNQRDTYRIGVAVDLLRVWNKLTTKTEAH